MKRSRLAADPNYLWTSPIEEEILMPIVHIVNEIGFLIPRFISKEHKKLYLFITNNPSDHGVQFQLGFLFFVDDKKIKESSELNRNELIKSEIKEGLIKMGDNYDWDKEIVDSLFQKIDF